MRKTTVVISGGFDPIHVGHVRMLKEAQQMADRLVVVINNDNWLVAKKGFAFMPEKERVEIIEAMLRPGDFAMLTAHVENDLDRSVCATLRKLHKMYEVDIFANGGDRLSDNVPEVQVCNELKIQMVFNVGGGKVQSSSEMVKKAKEKQ